MYYTSVTSLGLTYESSKVANGFMQTEYRAAA